MKPLLLPAPDRRDQPTRRRLGGTRFTRKQLSRQPGQMPGGFSPVAGPLRSGPQLRPSRTQPHHTHCRGRETRRVSFRRSAITPPCADLPLGIGNEQQHHKGQRSWSPDLTGLCVNGEESIQFFAAWSRFSTATFYRFLDGKSCPGWKWPFSSCCRCRHPHADGPAASLPIPTLTAKDPCPCGPADSRAAASSSQEAAPGRRLGQLVPCCPDDTHRQAQELRLWYFLSLKSQAYPLN